MGNLGIRRSDCIALETVQNFLTPDHYMPLEPSSQSKKVMDVDSNF